ncbi:MAG: Type 1 glutamine amidotransferase-like domain-containing protein [Polaribacter sp.]
MKKLIIASTSTMHGSGYLEYLLPTLKLFFANVKTLLFIPYARPSGISYKAYTAIVKKAFSKINMDVKGIHEFKKRTKAK